MEGQFNIDELLQENDFPAEVIGDEVDNLLQQLQGIEGCPPASSSVDVPEPTGASSSNENVQEETGEEAIEAPENLEPLVAVEPAEAQPEGGNGGGGEEPVVAGPPQQPGVAGPAQQPADRIGETRTALGPGGNPIITHDYWDPRGTLRSLRCSPYSALLKSKRKIGWHAVCHRPSCHFYNVHFWSMRMDLEDVLEKVNQNIAVGESPVNFHFRFRELFPHTFHMYGFLREYFIHFKPPVAEGKLFLPSRR
ncbi:uncharacterized protein LOC135838406 [Planococcus citri]|uniref:uncharacterized protein LOC135838406 n=1 Tax=Planococcus citri TaxID=170843 RepID=UPI0031F8D77C